MAELAAAAEARLSIRWKRQNGGWDISHFGNADGSIDWDAMIGSEAAAARAEAAAEEAGRQSAAGVYTRTLFSST